MEVMAEIKMPDLPEKVFQRVVELAYKVAGIHLTSEKRELVKSRLIKRMRKIAVTSFEDYLALVDAGNSDELPRMIDILTTNKTNFFRESAHFDFMRQIVLPEIRQRGRRLRIWSAACSSGEEPYTIAMVLREEIPDIDSWDARVLASDISTRMIEAATNGVYRADLLSDVEPAQRMKYFQALDPGQYRAHDSLRRLISFARLNLMQDWPMRGPFDLIFCRNVMIYFDRPTQERLVNRFYDLLRPGGHLFVGHSESLTPLEHRYQFVRPATYRRPD